MVGDSKNETEEIHDLDSFERAKWNCFCLPRTQFLMSLQISLDEDYRYDTHLYNHEDILRSGDDFIKFDDVRMSQQL